MVDHFVQDLWRTGTHGRGAAGAVGGADSLRCTGIWSSGWRAAQQLRHQATERRFTERTKAASAVTGVWHVSQVYVIEAPRLPLAVVHLARR
jgi:hypothetical protein